MRGSGINHGSIAPDTVFVILYRRYNRGTRSMKDCLRSGISDAARIRFTSAEVTTAAKALEARHLCGPTSGKVLAEGLAAVALLSADASAEDEAVYIRVKVDGPVGGLLAEATGGGHLRGFPNIKVLNELDEEPEIDTRRALGKAGSAQVIRSLPGKILNQAELRVAPPDASKVVARFFYESIQIPAAVEVYVKSDSAGVLIARSLVAEKMPDATTDEFVRVLEAFNSGQIRSRLAETANLHDIGSGLGIRDLRHRGTRELQFRCRCSRQKVEEAIATLPQSDIDEMLSDDRPHSVTCHMCASDYRLTCAEIRDLRTSIS